MGYRHKEKGIDFFSPNLVKSTKANIADCLLSFECTYNADDGFIH